MKIGIIFTAYGCAEYVEKSLAPWIELRNKALSQEGDSKTSIFISAVSVPFKDFDAKDDGTIQILKGYLNKGDIDSFAFSKSVSEKETVARQQTAKELLKKNVDLLWQVDADEFYTVDEIEKIIKFVDRQKFIVSFKLCLKNFIWDESHHLEEPFSPMRIHRVKSNGFDFAGFWDDNNANYYDYTTNVEARDIQLSSMTVPKNIAWVKHLTWLNNDRSRKKIEYQKKRWPACSFQWNDTTKSVGFNPEYYHLNGLVLPRVVKI